MKPNNRGPQLNNYEFVKPAYLFTIFIHRFIRSAKAGAWAKKEGRNIPAIENLESASLLEFKTRLCHS